MSAQRLETIRVQKPWGRRVLWPGFASPAADEAPIGEIWFQAPDGADAELLVKYLFTSERLSIQVHPDDAAAQKAGFSRGKEEAWIVLAAEPDATIALGTKAPITREQLRTAALDGTIVDLVDWRPVQAGDVIYSPAGTVHAIGAGLTLIEVQQNLDLTYRLYDYGRPRELQLDQGIAVADPSPYQAVGLGRSPDLLVEGRKFVIERLRTSTSVDVPTGWFIPVSGSGQIDGADWRAGECWLTTGPSEIRIGADSDCLFAYPGAEPQAFAGF